MDRTSCEKSGEIVNRTSSHGAQLIIQLEKSTGEFECAAFIGVPLLSPCRIIIESPNGSTGEAADLYAALLQELARCTPTMQRLQTGCSGYVFSPVDCHAFLDASCEDLLVLVGDPPNALTWRPFYSHWLNIPNNRRILPIFSVSAKPGVSNLLPPELSMINVRFWVRSIVDCVPDILSLAGLTTQDQRIFISYRQNDSPALAMQLFDALSHANFDVFLDHFRVPPGANFQARLTQELGTKSMVLLIESANILQSEWPTYEICVAKQFSLGLFSVQPPGGTNVPGIDPSFRRPLALSDFVGNAFNARARLTDAALERVVNEIKQQHDRAFLRRRSLLRETMRDMLLFEGVTNQYFDAQGILHAHSPSGNIEYLIWLAIRAPETPDFHVTHTNCRHPAKGVVVGLSRFMEPPTAIRTEWLAQLCQVVLVDEGEMKVAASQISAGTL
ncbi:MAG: toll/interleukin-1 receptor domain-containing protein [Acidiferrobacteraceae bacterium]